MSEYWKMDVQGSSLKSSAMQGQVARQDDWVADGAIQGKVQTVRAALDAIGGGIKHDQEKPRVDLLDADALEGLAKVLTFGANKYSAHNWRGGISYSRLIGAALRHLFAIMRGENTDPESGLPHVDHLGCCWMFLSNMMKTRKDMDDRRYVAPIQAAPYKSMENATPAPKERNDS